MDFPVPASLLPDILGPIQPALLHATQQPLLLCTPGMGLGMGIGRIKVR